MLQFENFLTEKKENITAKKGTGNAGAILHELLIGYYVRGGTGDPRNPRNKKFHMIKHPDSDNLSPYEAFSMKAALFEDAQFDAIAKRAKTTADTLVKKFEDMGISVKDVHWTSKAGDTERTTGIKASQKEDDSDVCFTLRRKGEKVDTYAGVSLKAYEENKKEKAK